MGGSKIVVAVRSENPLIGLVVLLGGFCLDISLCNSRAFTGPSGGVGTYPFILLLGDVVACPSVGCNSPPYVGSSGGVGIHLVLKKLNRIINPNSFILGD